MAFLKLIWFLAWVGIFLNLSNHVSLFQTRRHHQAVQSFLVWKIPRQQPCPTPKEEQNQHPEAQGNPPCSSGLPRAGIPLCTVPKTRGPQSQAQLWDWSHWEHDAHPPLPEFLQGQGDNSTFPDVPSCQSPPPSSLPATPGHRAQPEQGAGNPTPGPSCSTPEQPPRPSDSPVGPSSHPGVLPVVAPPAAQPSPGVEAAPVAPTVGAADAGHVGPLGQHLRGGEGLLELGFSTAPGSQGWQRGRSSPPGTLPALTLMIRPRNTLSSSSTAAFTELCSSNSM